MKGIPVFVLTFLLISPIVSYVLQDCSDEDDSLGYVIDSDSASTVDSSEVPDLVGVEGSQQKTKDPTTRQTTQQTTTTQTPTPITQPSPVQNDVDVLSCESGWQYFLRPSGGWCIQVNTVWGLSASEAQQQCKSLGGTLSGIQNNDERLWIMNTGISMLTSAAGCYWIGAKRTDSCMKSYLNPTCNATTSFQWTDGSTTGTDGFKWRSAPTQQPDNTMLRQNWAVIVTATTKTYNKWLVPANGLLDDTSSVLKNLYILDDCPLVGIVCGKQPTAS